MTALGGIGDMLKCWNIIWLGPPWNGVRPAAPEVLVQAVISRLKQLGAVSVREAEGIQENVVFPLPKSLSVNNQY